MTGGPRHETEGGAGALLGNVLEVVGRLVRGEVALARAEVTEGLREAGGGLARIAAAAVVAIVGLNALADAAAAGLVAAGLSPGLAYALVGLIACGIALVCALSGRAALRPSGLLPRRALRGLARDAEAAGHGLMKGKPEHV